jgi:hypothetical protein
MIKKLLLTLLLSGSALAADPQPIDPILNDTICKDLIMSGIKQTVGAPSLEFTLIKSSKGESSDGQLVVYNVYHVVNPATPDASFDVTVAVGVGVHKEI